MSEGLDEFPHQLMGRELMPWEEAEPQAVWPFGQCAGTPLRDFASPTLLRFRHLVEQKNGAGHYFDALLKQIDAVLLERAGE